MRGVVMGICLIGAVWNGMLCIYHIEALLNGEPGHLAPACASYVSAFLCGYGIVVLKDVVR